LILSKQTLIGKGTSHQKFWEYLLAYFPLYDTGHIENDASNNSSIAARVFVIAVTFLPSSCVAKIGGYLPSHCLAIIGDTHTDTQNDRRYFYLGR
jgi:hypothetical protein